MKRFDDGAAGGESQQLKLFVDDTAEATPDTAPDIGPDAAQACPFPRVFCGDARRVPLRDASVDLVVTSPPYWRKRDYGVSGQIGQEPDVGAYIAALLDALREWRRVLRPTGSAFINIGDSYHHQSLIGVPARLEQAAREDGWLVRNRIVWAKESGTPDPARNRLVGRHETVLHLAPRAGYFYDLWGYAQRFGSGSGANPGDVWTAKPVLHQGEHLAPFPPELVERAITLACPRWVCSECAAPRVRVVDSATQLDPARRQAARAMVLARQHGLTPEHLAAIRATGLCDAGKSLHTHSGAGRNATRVQQLAGEAKAALGGYFREFVGAPRQATGWTDCGCGAAWAPGVVLDPFMGTGTTLRVARAMGRSAIGVDLRPFVDEARAR